jgi:hypothetical protein
LAGDADLNGSVNTTDASQTKLYFGETANPNNAAFDYNVDGAINTTDFSQLKLNFEHQAPLCP